MTRVTPGQFMDTIQPIVQSVAMDMQAFGCHACITATINIIYFSIIAFRCASTDKDGHTRHLDAYNLRIL